jgi:hypothetical protein
MMVKSCLPGQVFGPSESLYARLLGRPRYRLEISTLPFWLEQAEKCEFH